MDFCCCWQHCKIKTLSENVCCSLTFMLIHWLQPTKSSRLCLRLLFHICRDQNVSNGIPGQSLFGICHKEGHFGVSKVLVLLLLSTFENNGFAFYWWLESISCQMAMLITSIFREMGHFLDLLLEVTFTVSCKIVDSLQISFVQARTIKCLLSIVLCVAGHLRHFFLILEANLQSLW